MFTLTADLRSALSKEIENITSLQIPCNELLVSSDFSKSLFYTSFFVKRKIDSKTFFQCFKSPVISDVVFDKQILHINLKPEFLFKYITRLSNTTKNSSKKLFIDFGGFCIAKPLHIGHSRTLFLGNFIKNLYNFFGYKVISDIHIGDWGFNIGCLLIGLEDRQLLSNPPKDIFALHSIYTQVIQQTKTDKDLYYRCKKATFFFQSKRDKYYITYKIIKEFSVDYIKKNLQDLDINFDLFLGESDAHSTCLDLLENFKKDDQGVYFTKLNNSRINLTAKEGYVLYFLTDLATIKDRIDKYNFNPLQDKMVYIIDLRQETHISNVADVALQIKLCSCRDNIIFVGFNTINNIKGKPLKTREGVCPSILDILKKAPSNFNLALSCLKFFILSFARNSKCNLDVDAIFNHSKRSASYVLYAITRLKSLINNKNASFAHQVLSFNNNVVPLLYACIKMLDACDLSFVKHDAYYITNALCLSARYFNIFYESCELDYTCLMVCKSFFEIYSQCLNLLGIKVPDNM